MLIQMPVYNTPLYSGNVSSQSKIVNHHHYEHKDSHIIDNARTPQEFVCLDDNFII